MKLKIEGDFESIEEAYNALLDAAVSIRQGAKQGFYRTPHSHIVKMKWELTE